MKKLILLFLLITTAAFAETGDTSNPIPSSNLSFLGDLRNFLKFEDAVRAQEHGMSSFVVSGGTHTTGAGLNKTPSSTIAYLSGYRTTESQSITYPDNDTCWVAIHKDITGSQPPWLRVAGTHYLLDCTSSVEAAAPTNGVKLMKVVTSGGAVTTVTNLVPNTTIFNADAFVSLASAITSIGSTESVLIISTNQACSTALTFPSTLAVQFIGSGKITKSTGCTLTFNGPFEAPLKQVFSGFSAGDITFGTGALRFANPQWWGGTSDATSLQKSITAFNTEVFSGSYSITATVTIPSNRDIVFHEGAKITQPSSTNLTVFLKNSDQSGGNENIRLVGVEIDGNKANNTGDVQVIGINLAKCSKCSVTYSKIHDLQGHSTSPPSVGIGVSGISDNSLVAFNDVRNLGDGTKTADGIFTKGKAIRVQGNVVYAIGDTGIVVEDSSSAEVVGNDVDTNNLGQCIAISLDTTDFNVAGNTCKNAKASNGAGIYVTKLSGSVGPTRGTLTGNVYKGDLVNGLGRGIYIEDAFDIQLSGNVSENAKNDGIFLQRVTRATVTGWEARKNGDYGLRISGGTDIVVGPGIASTNSQTTANVSSGILVNKDGSTESTGIVISGVRSFDETVSAGSKNQAYGIEVLDASEVVIQGNNVTGNRSGGMSIAGTATKQVRNNKGWFTENSGTGSITSGATTAVIAHGLSVAPVAKDIFVTFTENPTNDPGNVWISNITSTEFTVNVRSDPGASNLDFSWRAMVHP